MAALGLHDFACARYFDTQVNENEFFVWLRACDDLATIADSWRRMRDNVRTTSLPPLRRHVMGAPARLKLILRSLLRRHS